MRISRTIFGVLGILAVLYVGYAMIMIRSYRPLLYPFYEQRELTLDGFSAVPVPTDAGPVTVYVNDAPDTAPIVVYFMGNLGALQAYSVVLQNHDAKGRRVVGMAYRGGGGMVGAPSEARLKADALAVMDALPEITGGATGPVIVHGYSLGTGVAQHVAARREIDGLILSAPYARICELMVRASWLPACHLPGVDKWQSIGDADDVAVPALVLHGDDDATIPVRHGDRIAETLRAAGSDVTFLRIAGGGHSDLLDYPEYLAAIDDFIAERTD